MTPDDDTAAALASVAHAVAECVLPDGRVGGRLRRLDAVLPETRDGQAVRVREVRLDVTLTAPEGCGLLASLAADLRLAELTPEQVAARLGPAAGRVTVTAVQPRLLPGERFAAAVEVMARLTWPDPDATPVKVAVAVLPARRPAEPAGPHPVELAAQTRPRPPR
jgi:hypothetical protein